MALTSREEAFAQAIVSGKTQADAYRAAYSAKGKKSTVHEEASKIIKRHKVATRIAELRAPVIAKLQYGLEEAMNEADEAYRISKGKENGGAMIAAVTLRAKLNGLLVDKKEIKHSRLETMSEEELDKEITQKAREAGVSIQ